MAEEVWDIALGKAVGPFQFGSTLSEVIYALMVFGFDTKEVVKRYLRADCSIEIRFANFK